MGLICTVCITGLHRAVIRTATSSPVTGLSCAQRQCEGCTCTFLRSMSHLRCQVEIFFMRRALMQWRQHRPRTCLRTSHVCCQSRPAKDPCNDPQPEARSPQRAAHISQPAAQTRPSHRTSTSSCCEEWPWACSNACSQAWGRCPYGLHAAARQACARAGALAVRVSVGHGAPWSSPHVHGTPRTRRTRRPAACKHGRECTGRVQPGSQAAMRPWSWACAQSGAVAGSGRLQPARGRSIQWPMPGLHSAVQSRRPPLHPSRPRPEPMCGALRACGLADESHGIIRQESRHGAASVHGACLRPRRDA